jgi:UDP-N-acetylmuramate--alanine ligase
MPGFHNVLDLSGAIAVARELGAVEEGVRRALGALNGVKRRFELRFQKHGRVLIDDYAHHPTEIKAVIRTVRELYPGKRVTGVFQPHLYSRTRDHAEGFSEALSGLDELYLLPIYPAREEAIPGVTSELLFQKARCEEQALVGKGELLKALRSADPELLLVLGAGDVSGMVGDLELLMEELAEKEGPKKEGS